MKEAYLMRNVFYKGTVAVVLCVLWMDVLAHMKELNYKNDFSILPGSLLPLL